MLSCVSMHLLCTAAMIPSLSMYLYHIKELYNKITVNCNPCQLYLYVMKLCETYKLKKKLKITQI